MLGIRCSARSGSMCILFRGIDKDSIVREVMEVNSRKLSAGPQTPSIPDPRRLCALSPSQKIQSQAQRKHVVASGLLHRLHDRAGANGRDDAMERPDELPGGTVDPARINDIFSSSWFSKLRELSLSGALQTIECASVPLASRSRFDAALEFGRTTVRRPAGAWQENLRGDKPRQSKEQN